MPQSLPQNRLRAYRAFAPLVASPRMSDDPRIDHREESGKLDSPRHELAIGYTGFVTGPAAPRLLDTSKFLPFVGILMGLSYIGHSVWVFEGHPSALAAGCRDADVLIVDSGMRPFLRAGWEDEASQVMRNCNIVLHDRATFQLRVIRKVGSGAGLEFPR